jgi:hypothetical protein
MSEETSQEMFEDLIMSTAIILALKQKPTLSPGDTCVHASDDMSYQFYRYENGKAVVGYNGVCRSFPAEEVFDVNLVLKISIDIAARSSLISLN